MTTSAELDPLIVVVTPGEETTATLTVRNGGDIVEAYEFEIVGASAGWAAVEPGRLSLYPGTSETVQVVLRPPRTSEVPVGEIPIGVRVIPAERPETATVPEGTLVVRPFHELTAEVVPQVRRARRRARYRISVRNAGNTTLSLPHTGLEFLDTEEQLRFDTAHTTTAIEPGATAEIDLRTSIRRLRWFGKPVIRPFQVVAATADTTSTTEQDTEITSELGQPGSAADDPADTTAPRAVSEAQFVQLAVLPQWLLWLLAALLALLALWFGLVRPAVETAAREAAEERAEEMAETGEFAPTAPPPTEGGTGDEGGPGSGGGVDGPDDASGATEPGSGEGRGGGIGEGEQLTVTIEVEADGGESATGRHTVDEDQLFRVTDILVSNYQGDEGIVTITFDETVIARIALETFRNQDYHWVTPIDVPAETDITVQVDCAQPGTPASGEQAAGCVELLNVSGTLVTLED